MARKRYKPEEIVAKLRQVARGRLRCGREGSDCNQNWLGVDHT